MNAAEVLARIRKGNRFWVSGHIDSDGDSITSVLLLGRLLRHLGKDYVLYIHDSLPPKFEFLAGIEEITNELPEWEPDILLTVDTPEPKRLGFTPPKVEIINIDHHPSNTGYGEINWLDESRSCASLMVLELLRKAGAKPGKEEGELVFTGIYTETGGFAYPNVTVEAFRVCSQMLDLGVDASDIALRMTARDERNLALLGSVLATLKLSQGIATIELTDSMLKKAGVNHRDQDSDSFIRYPASVPGVKIAVFLREDRVAGEVRLSFRSIKGIDVNELASRFGGGGHHNAAGARIRGSYREVKKRVVEETKRYLTCVEG